jgi:hypothetical protein
LSRAGAAVLGVLAGGVAVALLSRLPARRAGAGSAAAEDPDRTHAAAHAALLARVASEPIAPAWSARMTDLVTRGLESEAPRGRFRVARVDCRSTACIATLEWRSRTDALASYGALAHALPDLPCTSELMLDAATTATLVLACDEQRRF